MHIERAVRAELEHRAGNVRAMVGNTLEIIHYVVKNKALFYRAFAFFQALDMVCLRLIGKCVHNLFKRLYMGSDIQIAVRKCAVGKRYDLAQRLFDNIRFAARAAGKFYLLRVQLLGGFKQIEGVIAESLKVAYGAEHSADHTRVAVRKLRRADFYKICAERIFVQVKLLLLSANDLRRFFVVSKQSVKSGEQHFLRLGTHFKRERKALLHGDGRRYEKSFVGAVGMGVFLFAGLVFYYALRQTDKLLCKRHQHGGGNNIERRVNSRNAPRRGILAEQCRLEYYLCNKEYRKADDRSENIHRGVHKRNALCLGRSPDGREYGGDTGADIESHYDRDRRRVGQSARNCERL